MDFFCQKKKNSRDSSAKECFPKKFFSDTRLYNSPRLIPFFHVSLIFKTAYPILNSINLAQARPQLNMEDEFCQKVDLNLDISIDLPANAPQGHPHLLNVKRPRNNPQPPKYKKRKSNQIEFPEDLSLVDVLATILFDWKPAALHHLLNVQNEQFYCAAEWEQDNLEYDAWERFVYVHRLGQYVRIAVSAFDE